MKNNTFPGRYKEISFEEYLTKIDDFPEDLSDAINSLSNRRTKCVRVFQGKGRGHYSNVEQAFKAIGVNRNTLNRHLAQNLFSARYQTISLSNYQKLFKQENQEEKKD